MDIKEMIMEFRQFQHKRYTEKLKMARFENISFKIEEEGRTEVSIELTAEFIIITPPNPRNLATVIEKSHIETYNDEQEDNSITIYLTPPKPEVNFIFTDQGQRTRFLSLLRNLLNLSSDSASSEGSEDSGRATLM